MLAPVRGFQAAYLYPGFWMLFLVNAMRGANRTVAPSYTPGRRDIAIIAAEVLLDQSSAQI
jgi:hypothetical protein